MLKREYDQICSIARTLEVLGERWTLLIIRDVFNRKRRFEQLQENLGIARNVLSARLAWLVEEGDPREARLPGAPAPLRVLPHREGPRPVAGDDLDAALGRQAPRRATGPPMLIRHKDCDGLVDDRGVCDVVRQPPRGPRRLHRVRPRRPGRAGAKPPRRASRPPWTSSSPTSSGCCATPCASSPAARSPRSPRSSTGRRPSPTSSSRKMGELGLMGIPFPEEYGGGGADTLSYALVRRGAGADRLVGLHHARRPHLARHDADPPLGHRRAEVRVAAAALRRASGSPPSASPSPRPAPTPARPAPARGSTTASG